MEIIIRNSAIQGSYRSITGDQAELQKVQEKLSSGMMNVRASDDAAKLGISDKMRAQIMGLEAEQKDAQDGISLIQTADTALSEIQTVLGSMAELADKSAGGTITEEADIDVMQSDFDNLLSRIGEITKFTTFNGERILNGIPDTRNDMSPEAEVLNDISELCAKHMRPLIDPGPYDVGSSGVRIDSPQNAGLTSGKVRKAADEVSATRENLRGYQKTLEQKLRGLTIAGENLTAAGSRIQDMDTAKDILAFTKKSVLSQSGLAAISQASVQAQSVLNLLK